MHRWRAIGASAALLPSTRVRQGSQPGGRPGGWKPPSSGGSGQARQHAGLTAGCGRVLQRVGHASLYRHAKRGLQLVIKPVHGRGAAAAGRADGRPGRPACESRPSGGAHHLVRNPVSVILHLQSDVSRGMESSNLPPDCRRDPAAAPPRHALALAPLGRRLQVLGARFEGARAGKAGGQRVVDQPVLLL